MNPESKLRLRGHHLFCMNVAQFDRYVVYNRDFSANAQRAGELMRRNPETKIEVVAGACDTCQYCPYLVGGEGRCQLYDYIEGADEIDRRMLDQLGLKVGQVITAAELRGLIAARFSELPTMCFLECPFRDVLGCSEGLKLVAGTRP